jgi:hypothetical protein
VSGDSAMHLSPPGGVDDKPKYIAGEFDVLAVYTMQIV